jgi:hypothetical protein
LETLITLDEHCVGSDRELADVDLSEVRALMLAVEDQIAIQRLYSSYAQFVDANRVDEWVALFTPDGVLVASETYTGRAELTSFILQRAALQDTLPYRDAQHWISNLLLEEDGQVVHGSCYVARFAIDRASGRREIVSLGRYEDEVVRHDGAWKFARKVAFPS